MGIAQREFSILMKLRTRLLLDSSGLQRRESYVMKTCVPSGSIYMMWLYTQMQSTGVVVKLSLPLEGSVCLHDYSWVPTYGTSLPSRNSVSGECCWRYLWCLEQKERARLRRSSDSWYSHVRC